jgi:HEAT repeat protein
MMSLYKPDVQKLLKKQDVPMLMKALGDGDWRVRRDAAAALGTLRDEQAVEALLIALSDADPEVCAAAATALGEIGKGRAVIPLVAALRGKPQVRLAAIRALGTLRDSRAIEPLVRILERQADAMSEEAANALGETGDQRAIPFLIEAIQSKKFVREAYIKLACYQAVQRIANVEIPSTHIRLLVEALATEITHLYYRIATVRWGEFVDMDGNDPVRVIRLENWAEPDITGIRALVAQIPETLRDEVRARVDEESKALF